MTTFIALIDWTDRGARDAGDTAKRAAAFHAKAEDLGAKIVALYWTMGHHDGVLIFEAPDDETAAALTLWLARQGNARTETLRAFDREGIGRVMAKV